MRSIDLYFFGLINQKLYKYSYNYPFYHTLFNTSQTSFCFSWSNIIKTLPSEASNINRHVLNCMMDDKLWIMALKNNLVYISIL